MTTTKRVVIATIVVLALVGGGAIAATGSVAADTVDDVDEPCDAPNHVEEHGFENGGSDETCETNNPEG